MRILDAAYRRAKAVLKERCRELKALAGALLEHETLDQSAIEKVLAADEVLLPKAA